MSIYRIQSGLIFDDNFETLGSRWVVSPSDSYTYDEVDKTLTLEHTITDRSANALFELPQEEDELLLQVHAEYTPKLLGDEGGIVVWKNALEKVEFLESEDTYQAGDYSVWRAVKRQNLWTFFAQKSNAWELFDSTVCIDPIMAGVVLKGTRRLGYEPLTVDRVILCRGTSVSVGNVNGGYMVELVDSSSMSVVSSQVVPDGYSGVDIELPTVPFNGFFKIYDKDDEGNYVLIDEQKESTDMYGGDIFLRGTDLKVIWKGQELSEVKPTHLGALKNGEIEHKMTVVNDTTGNVAENVVISVAVYHQDFGWEWCDLAPDVEGSPGVYEDISISVGNLSEGEYRDFWVKITRKERSDGTSGRQEVRPTHFFLEIRND